MLCATPKFVRDDSWPYGSDAKQVFVANADVEQPASVGEHWPASLTLQESAARLIAPKLGANVLALLRRARRPARVQWTFLDRFQPRTRLAR